VGNLVKAAKAGFQGFAGRFGTHLKKGLIDWLTGSLPGIYIPRAFNLGELVKFVFSVLGLTWANVRAKLVKVVGEPAVKVMETGFDIVVTLVTQGPAAAWEKIKEALGNLQDMVVGGITDLVVDTVTKKAIPKLIAMFIPGAGFITAILSIYDTVMVFVSKISKIIQVVTGFINSITAIAAGNITAAAKRVEDVLSGLLTLAINFLAGFAGLGRVSDKIMGVINKVRAPIDKALDALVNWVVTMAKKLFAKAFGKKDEKGDPQGSAVKQKVAAELRGRKVESPEQAAALTASIYSRFSKEGLKGIRLVYDPAKSPDVRVMVNASPVTEVANLPANITGLKKAIDFAYRFRYDTGTTVLYAYYDQDSKPYGQVIENEPGGQHAEEIFVRQHLPALKARIASERAAGKLLTPAGQRVQVTINLNRLPCSMCSPLMARVAAQNPDLWFIVRASSVSNSQATSEEIHVQFLEQLLADEKGNQLLDVQPLHIHEAIWNKVVQVGNAVKAKKIGPFSQDRALEVAIARPIIMANIAQTAKVEELIAEAKRRVAAKKALAATPPQGAGV
jgi:hypothetical protein